MSMNLYITVNGTEIEVFQTPTHITFMCLMNDKGEVSFEVTGKKALRAIRCYMVYVKTLLNGRFDSVEEANDRRKSIMDHIAGIESVMIPGAKLKAYTL